MYRGGSEGALFFVPFSLVVTGVVFSGCADGCAWCRSAAGFDEGYAQDDYLGG